MSKLKEIIYWPVTGDISLSMLVKRKRNGPTLAETATKQVLKLFFTYRSKMQQNYVHTPLKYSFSTRVLLLEPALTSTAPFRCRLEEVSLHSSPDYSALSYAWDAQSPSCPVECDGNILKVTPNCQAALRRLRNQHDDCRLWIDSVCIDQTSLVERSQQVAIMGEIYKRAKRVVVWLGEGDPATEVAMRRILDIGQLGVAKIKSDEEKTRLDDTLRLLFGIGAVDSSQDPLSPFFELSWFHRMWTVQEVTLPPLDNVDVQYGPVSSKWVFVLLAVKLLKITKYKWGKWDEATHLQKEISAMFMEKRNPPFREILETDSADAVPYRGTLQLLVSMRPKKATDSRDKVFALIGVAKELGLDLPPPDYGKSLEQVYIETAVVCIKNDSSLNALYEAPSKNRRAGLPSWVPDWGDESWNSFELSKYVAEKAFRAAGANNPQWSFSQDWQRLIVSGKLIDSIDTCCAALELETDFNNDFVGIGSGKTKFKDFWKRFQPPVDILRTWVHLSSQCKTYPTKEPVESAFRSTLLDGSFVRKQHTPSDVSFEKWFDFMKSSESDALTSLFARSQGSHIQSTGKSNLTDKGMQDEQKTFPAAGFQSFLALSSTSASEFHFAALRQAKGKCFFSTTNGYFGLAIGTAQSGDQIALIPGLDIPFILRKAGQRYTLVTYGYVHGIMCGEGWNTPTAEILTIA